MTALMAAMIEMLMPHPSPMPIVAWNIANFANHPASGGIPASDMKKIAVAAARPGA